MSEPWNEPWFWPVVIVVIGLPILLIVTTEITRALEARGNAAASIVRLVRNFVLPLGALLLLLTQVDNLELEVNWTRIVATVFGFALILVVINLLNFALFATASHGSWRERLPTIFIDIIKLVVIVVCFALLFQWVWQADVGGLFTALGVTSIVVGLALQNAAGSVVSGLLLLFEQPFKIGDWLETGSVRGRVVEVNWRAVHIDTGNGTFIVPTASLAGSSFTNLSRVTDFYEAQTTVTFAKGDAPSDVATVVATAARDLPFRLPETSPEITPKGAGVYHVSIAVARPADEGPTIALLIAWLWFASRRAGLHLDGDATDTSSTPERKATAVRRLATRLRLDEEDAALLLASSSIERFGTGETLVRAGTVSPALHYVIDGDVALIARHEGRPFEYHTLSAPEPVCLGVYTRQPEADTARATNVVTTLSIPRDVIDTIIGTHPRLAIELGRVSDNRRELTAKALAAVVATISR